jgi:hypothetical protein
MALGNIGGRALRWLSEKIKPVGATLGLTTCLTACGGLQTQQQETAARCAEVVEVAQKAELSSCIDANADYNHLNATLFSGVCAPYQQHVIQERLRSKFLPFLNACVAGKDLRDCEQLNAAYDFLSSVNKDCTGLESIKKELDSCWPTVRVVALAGYIQARVDTQCE